jgi:hypothetical protein
VKHKKNFANNTFGVVFVWAVAAATLAMASILWFALSWPTTILIDWATSYYGFNSYTLTMINFARVIVGTTFGFVVFGVVIYVLVNSNRRQASDLYVG